MLVSVSVVAPHDRLAEREGHPAAAQHHPTGR